MLEAQRTHRRRAEGDALADMLREWYSSFRETLKAHLRVTGRGANRRPYLNSLDRRCNGR